MEPLYYSAGWLKNRALDWLTFRALPPVNFRREPIYLTDDQLNTKAFVGYRRTLAMVPSLGELRRLFIGRVMHHSPEQWRDSVTQLLRSGSGSS